MALPKGKPAAEVEKISPRQHLERLDGHRHTLFIAAWEATHGDVNAEKIQELTKGQISAAAMRAWLRGNYVPTIEAAEMIASVFGRSRLAGWLEEGEVYYERIRQAAIKEEMAALQREAVEHARHAMAEAGSVDGFMEYLDELPPDRVEAIARRLASRTKKTKRGRRSSA